MQKPLDNEQKTIKQVGIKPIDAFDAAQRTEILKLAFDFYKADDKHIFIGLGQDEIDAISGTKPNHESFYVLLANAQTPDQTIIGMCALVWKKDGVEMDGIYTCPAYRGQGYGKLAILNCIYLATTAQENHRYRADKLDISVLSDNKYLKETVALYESFGATNEGQGEYRQFERVFSTTHLSINIAAIRSNAALLAELANYLKPFITSTDTYQNIDMRNQSVLIHKLEMHLAQHQSDETNRLSLGPN